MTTLNQQPEIQRLWQILKYTFGLVPIVAGADKFLNLLTQWKDYLNPTVANALPFDASIFMMIVGVVEIIAGIMVLTQTKIGAYIVSAWLVLIALSLILGGSHLDVAVRDLVMAISAYVLAKLTEVTGAGKPA
ncbi:hypothetical protein [Chitinophaga defluvii]|uniref:tRNA (5-methylaminomethyl-2-thiouridylate)-methyltransferase n=1 Tax=Chitinophaga defluvii TaxID=3163343 RepID=A0ABV2T8H2_9BACT